MEDNEYFKYLTGRSSLGLFYRRVFLYPRLKRYLNGDSLDIGCGIGDLLQFQRGMKGVDVNPKTVEFCRSRGLDARLMPFDELPFAAATFDRIVLDNVLEHLSAPRPLLAEIARVMRPDGKIIVGVPGSRGYAADPDHKIFYDEPGLVDVLAKAGFHVSDIFHAPFRSAYLEQRMRQYCIYGVFSR